MRQCVLVIAVILISTIGYPRGTFSYGLYCGLDLNVNSPSQKPGRFWWFGDNVGALLVSKKSISPIRFGGDIQARLAWTFGGITKHRLTVGVGYIKDDMFVNWQGNYSNTKPYTLSIWSSSNNAVISSSYSVIFKPVCLSFGMLLFSPVVRNTRWRYFSDTFFSAGSYQQVEPMQVALAIGVSRLFYIGKYLIIEPEVKCSIGVNRWGSFAFGGSPSLERVRTDKISFGINFTLKSKSG
ncbi:MAG: hypothetical protein U0T84_05955 [Chitinophagales bacterium]